MDFAFLRFFRVAFAASTYGNASSSFDDKLTAATDVVPVAELFKNTGVFSNRPSNYTLLKPMHTPNSSILIDANDCSKFALLVLWSTIISYFSAKLAMFNQAAIVHTVTVTIVACIYPTRHREAQRPTELHGLAKNELRKVSMERSLRQFSCSRGRLRHRMRSKGALFASSLNSRFICSLSLP